MLKKSAECEHGVVRDGPVHRWARTTRARRTAPAPRAPSWSSHRASLRPRALPLCPSASPQRCHASARRTPSDELPSDVRERAAVSLGAEPLAEPLEPSAYRAFRLCDECRTQAASVYATSLPHSCSFALRSGTVLSVLAWWACFMRESGERIPNIHL